jgi:hypothetical protein
MISAQRFNPWSLPIFAVAVACHRLQAVGQGSDFYLFQPALSRLKNFTQGFSHFFFCGGNG